MSFPSRSELSAITGSADGHAVGCRVLMFRSSCCHTVLFVCIGTELQSDIPRAPICRKRGLLFCRLACFTKLHRVTAWNRLKPFRKKSTQTRKFKLVLLKHTTSAHTIPLCYQGFSLLGYLRTWVLWERVPHKYLSNHDIIFS